MVKGDRGSRTKTNHITEIVMQTNHLSTAARRSLLFLMLALLLGGGSLSAPANTADQVASSAQEAKPIEVGTAAPDAGLRDLDGNDVTLFSGASILTLTPKSSANFFAIGSRPRARSVSIQMRSSPLVQSSSSQKQRSRKSPRTAGRVPVASTVVQQANLTHEHKTQ